MFSWLENLGVPTFLILIGAILSAVGAFWASNQQARKSDEISKLNTEIAGHQRELSKELSKQLELQKELRAKAEEQGELQQQLRLKAEEIAHLNRELKNTFIGGDSFCYLEVMTLDPKTDTGILSVFHEGKYPFYDVLARVVDLQKFNEVKDRLSLDTMKYTDSNIRIGNLIPAHGAMLQPFQLGNAIERGFNIFFQRSEWNVYATAATQEG